MGQMLAGILACAKRKVEGVRVRVAATAPAARCLVAVDDVDVFLKKTPRALARATISCRRRGMKTTPGGNRQRATVATAAAAASSRQQPLRSEQRARGAASSRAERIGNCAKSITMIAFGDNGTRKRKRSAGKQRKGRARGRGKGRRCLLPVDRCKCCPAARGQWQDYAPEE